jgi:hypothetical protein
VRSTDDMHALTRRCEWLIRLLFATIGLMWVVWVMIWQWSFHGGITTANHLFRIKHPELTYEQIAPLEVGDIGFQIARSFTNFALFGVVLPATVLLLVAWLMLRRLRKEIVRKW